MKAWGFALVAFLALAAPLAAAQGVPPPERPTPEQQDPGWWLPEAASDYSWQVDRLYLWIFYVVIGMFVLTEGLLIVFCILYRRRPGHRPTYTHGNNKAEITWTVVPALMLLALAIIQIPAWNHIKKPDWAAFRADPNVVKVDVLGQTFKWNIRYPGTKEKFKVENDYTNLSNVHVPLGAPVLFNLRSADVIHSVFIPHMRVKQDTVPGLRQSLWFRPNRLRLIDLKSPLVEDGKTFYGEPRKVQRFEWVNDEKEFMDPAGKYFNKRIALSAIQDYAIVQEKPGDEANKGKEGQYVPYMPGGKPKKVRVLYQGKVLHDEGEGTEAWDSCDYALGYFEIACAELCGIGHHTMRGFLVVEPKVSYDVWLETQALSEPPVLPIWKAWRQ